MFLTLCALLLALCDVLQGFETYHFSMHQANKIYEYRNLGQRIQFNAAPGECILTWYLKVFI